MKTFVHLTRELLDDLSHLAVTPEQKAFVSVSNEIGNEWDVEVKITDRLDDSFIIEFED